MEGPVSSEGGRIAARAVDPSHGRRIQPTGNGGRVRATRGGCITRASERTSVSPTQKRRENKDCPGPDPVQVHGKVALGEEQHGGEQTDGDRDAQEGERQGVTPREGGGAVGGKAAVGLEIKGDERREGEAARQPAEVRGIGGGGKSADREGAERDGAADSECEHRRREAG